MDIKLTQSDINRFFHYVWPDPVGPNRCILFAGSLGSNGYGQLNISKHPTPTHRIAWVISNGQIPEHLCVCHTCDNKACVNVNHLFLGTKSDNAKDMVSKNRSASGELHSQSKITRQQANIIYNLANEKKMKQSEIAKMFGIDRSQVSNIKLGKYWSGSILNQAHP